MEHADQIQRVITALQEMVNDSTKGALVMTYDNADAFRAGEVHIVSANGTPYPQLVGLFVACMHAVVQSTGITMEQFVTDIARALDHGMIEADDAGPVH
jgi:hypothetical protein